MMAAQMRNFVDQTGSLWMQGALVNKVASVMTATATQHGGQELALVTIQASLQHHGMIIVPLSYACQDQMGTDVVRGGAPYGMTTTSGGDGSRMPSQQELEGRPSRVNGWPRLPPSLPLDRLSDPAGLNRDECSGWPAGAPSRCFRIRRRAFAIGNNRVTAIDFTGSSSNRSYVIRATDVNQFLM